MPEGWELGTSFVIGQNERPASSAGHETKLCLAAGYILTVGTTGGFL